MDACGLQDGAHRAAGDNAGTGGSRTQEDDTCGCLLYTSEGTEIGKQAQAYMDRGEFVPDSVTNAMVKARLAAPDAADGFLLDGYPRSVEQAHVLRDMLLDLGKSCLLYPSRCV